MKNIKTKLPYIIGLVISVLGLLSMLFAYFVTTGGPNMGFNAYQLLSLSSLGFWWVLLCIFHVLMITLFIITIVICTLKLLDETGILTFKITFRKVTSFLVLKCWLILLTAISVVEMFLTWFLILANGDFGLVFGAGTFVLIGILLIGYVVFLFLERNDYFNKDQE